MFFSRKPLIMQIRSYGNRFASVGSVQGWWFVMVPALALVAVALAFLLFPVFFAYLTGFLLMMGGVSLGLWALRLRIVENRLRRRVHSQYGEIIIPQSSQAQWDD